MNGYAYLCVSCDVDPDMNPPYQKFHKINNLTDIWKGVEKGIAAFRQGIYKTNFEFQYGQLPITWLLRSDRQIYELYDDPIFCFKQFENIWKVEINKYKSEIGWHLHLYSWDRHVSQWVQTLFKDDDVDLLEKSLDSLRRYTKIEAVRTGWDYCSNNLMTFFERKNILVDASAIPGSVQSGRFIHNWAGTPRIPYLPSRSDYRRAAKFHAEALKIIELPVLVRSLNFPLQLPRYCLRNLRAIRGTNDFSSWESSKWQGMIITGNCNAFNEAVYQSLSSTTLNSQIIFINTYFHADELLSTKCLRNFAQNLESLYRLTKLRGYDLIPTTLSNAGSLLRDTMLT